METPAPSPTPDATAGPRSPRRICMVAYAFYDTDNRIRRYAETLVRHGDMVEVLALRHPGEPSTSTCNGVRVHRIQTRRRNETGPFSYLLRMLRFWFKSAARLAWQHWRKPYALIHVHSVPDFEVFAAWIPRLAGAAVILDIHDIVPEFYADKFGISHRSLVFRALLRAERLACRFASHVIIANHLWHKLLTTRALPADKCSVFLNHVDRSIFGPPQRTRTADGRFVMVYPGGLQPHQGLDVAIRAMTAIRQAVPGAELHLYGEGSQREALQQLIAERGLTDAVRLREPVPLQAVPAILANADLGIVPKRAEGFGNEAYSTKIQEFMSQGLPVVASRTRVDTYYFNERIVRFFESGNEAALAQAVIALARDPAARTALAREATAYIANQYWEHHENEYLALVDRLIKT